MNPVAFRIFLLSRLPLVYFTGIRVESLDENACTTRVRYGWLTQNPFRSLYFAVMQMAAELSTGVLCQGHIHGSKPSISMLVLKTEGVYHKKATGLVRFTCEDGPAIAAAVQQAKQSNEGVPVRCFSVGKNEAGEVVAECWITWSFRKRSSIV